jgi:ABC-type Mn2+/Zn2+ transport system ATPase subunit
MSASISAARLAVGYGHRPVVSDIDLELLPGQLLVLIGTNGSGKSTLLKTLAGLVAPTCPNTPSRRTRCRCVRMMWWRWGVSRVADCSVG